MTDKKSNDSRRKLLKSIAVGSGAVVAGKSLPESWTKPIVNSILLPAHALTTGCCEIAGTYCGSMTEIGVFTRQPREYPFEIIVTVDGLVTIDIDDGEDTGSAQTSCLGGTFTAPLDGEDEVSITGTVGCGLTDITGSLWVGATEEYSYTVSVDGC